MNRSQIKDSIWALEENIKKQNYKSAYEYAENLFISTKYIHFFNVCAYCKNISKIKGKDILYLSYAGQNEYQREYLKAISCILLKRKKEALQALTDSLKLCSLDTKDIPMFILMVESDVIIIKESLSDARETIIQNIQSLKALNSLRSYKIVASLIDSYSFTVGNKGQIKMKVAEAEPLSASQGKISRELVTQEIIKYPIEEYNCIKAKINPDHLADNIIKLIPKPKSKVPEKDLVFEYTDTEIFSFLLFLIYERKCGGNEWLDRLNKSIKIKDDLYSSFVQVLEWCGYHEIDIGESTEYKWWHQRNKRRFQKSEISKLADDINIKGDIVQLIEGPGKSGRYELNPCLKQALIDQPE